MNLFEREFIIDELPDVANLIIKKLQIPSIILLYGNLGSGKTTLVRSIASILNVNERIQSPTFNIHHRHRGIFKEVTVTIHHLDLYRLETDDSSWDFDFTETENDSFLAFIEWPDKMDFDWTSLSYPVFEITLDHKGNDEAFATKRKINMVKK